MLDKKFREIVCLHEDLYKYMSCKKCIDSEKIIVIGYLLNIYFTNDIKVESDKLRSLLCQ